MHSFLKETVICYETVSLLPALLPFTDINNLWITVHKKCQNELHMQPNMPVCFILCEDRCKFHISDGTNDFSRFVVHFKYGVSFVSALFSVPHK